ncbi:hypothetical protein RB653_005696 [Dictyostelium firmibasis]|uniref:Uncharacterized protein n=1 Tax=Dictyostelium firmibasis TaxID=79012 RepID=A0AAN7YT64_9MYCE
MIRVIFSHPQSNHLSNSAFFVALEHSSPIKSPTKNYYRSPKQGESLDDFHKKPISPPSQQKITNPTLTNTFTSTPLSTNKKRKLSSIEYENASKVSSYYSRDLKSKVLYYCLDSKCNKSGDPYNCTNGHSNLISHLRKGKCEMGIKYYRDRNLEPPIQPLSGQTLINQFYKAKDNDDDILQIPFNSDTCMIHLAIAISKEDLPITFADSDYIKLCYASSKFPVPSSKKITGVLDKMTPEIKKNVFIELRNGSNSVIHDSVLTSNGLNIYGTKFRNCSNSFEVKTILASIDAIEESKNANFIASTISNVIYESNIPEVVGITGDSASNCIAASKLVNVEYKRLKYGSTRLIEKNVVVDDDSIPCLPHLLSIVGSAFYTNNDVHIKKGLCTRITITGSENGSLNNKLSINKKAELSEMYKKEKRLTKFESRLLANNNLDDSSIFVKVKDIAVLLRKSQIQKEIKAQTEYNNNMKIILNEIKQQNSKKKKPSLKIRLPANTRFLTHFFTISDLLDVETLVNQYFVDNNIINEEDGFWDKLKYIYKFFHLLNECVVILSKQDCLVSYMPYIVELTIKTVENMLVENLYPEFSNNLFFCLRKLFKIRYKINNNNNILACMALDIRFLLNYGESLGISESAFISAIEKLYNKKSEPNNNNNCSSRKSLNPVLVPIYSTSKQQKIKRYSNIEEIQRFYKEYSIERTFSGLNNMIYNKRNKLSTERIGQLQQIKEWSRNLPSIISKTIKSL